MSSNIIYWTFYSTLLNYLNQVKGSDIPNITLNDLKDNTFTLDYKMALQAAKLFYFF